jgi:hypothetical protein
MFAAKKSAYTSSGRSATAVAKAKPPLSWKRLAYRDVLAAKYRRPDRWFDVAFWHQADIATEPIDVRLREIDAILERCITDPVSPSFMAPPATRPVEHRLSVA